MSQSAYKPTLEALIPAGTPLNASDAQSPYKGNSAGLKALVAVLWHLRRECHYLG